MGHEETIEFQHMLMEIFIFLSRRIQAYSNSLLRKKEAVKK